MGCGRQQLPATPPSASCASWWSESESTPVLDAFERGKTRLESLRTGPEDQVSVRLRAIEESSFTLTRNPVNLRTCSHEEYSHLPADRG